MTPSDQRAKGSNDPNRDAGAAVSLLSYSTLKKRPDFLAAARGRRAHAKGFVLQARERDNTENAPTDIRVGYTCSKKVGNAVARNRAKRRLRAAAAEVVGKRGQAGWDYVLIGRSGLTAALPFDQLCDDLGRELKKLHKS